MSKPSTPGSNKVLWEWLIIVEGLRNNACPPDPLPCYLLLQSSYTSLQPHDNTNAMDSPRSPHPTPTCHGQERLDLVDELQRLKATSSTQATPPSQPQDSTAFDFRELIWPNCYPSIVVSSVLSLSVVYTIGKSEQTRSIHSIVCRWWDSKD